MFEFWNVRFSHDEIYGYKYTRDIRRKRTAKVGHMSRSRWQSQFFNANIRIFADKLSLTASHQSIGNDLSAAATSEFVGDGAAKGKGCARSKADVSDGLGVTGNHGLGGKLCLTPFYIKKVLHSGAKRELAESI